MLLIIIGFILSIGASVGSYFGFHLNNLSPWYLFLLIPFFITYFVLYLNVYWLIVLIGIAKYKKIESPGRVNLYHLFNVRLVSSFVLAINGVIVKAKGLKDRPKEPGLYLFNHASDYDSWAIYKCTKGRYAFVGKKALRHIMMVRCLASSIGTLYVENGNNEQNHAMVDAAVDYISNKQTSVFIAPEGTRNLTGKILPFKHGGFNIAKRCNCPIYLVGIKGMEKTMDNNYKGIKKAYIELFDVVEPKDYEGYSAGQIAELCEEKYRRYFGDVNE